MRDLRYSKEMNCIVEVQDSITAEEALRILVKELLGANYYIVSPISAEQGNAVKVQDILRKYKKG